MRITDIDFYLARMLVRIMIREHTTNSSNIGASNQLKAAEIYNNGV